MSEGDATAASERSPFGGFRYDESKDTLAVRIARYDAYAKRCTFFAAGLGGLLLLVGQNTLLDRAPWLEPWIATIALVGVVCSALAYIPFVMARDSLQARVEDAKAAARPSDELNSGPRIANEVDKFPRSARTLYQLALLLLIVAGGLFIAGIWAQ